MIQKRSGGTWYLMTYACVVGAWGRRLWALGGGPAESRAILGVKPQDYVRPD